MKVNLGCGQAYMEEWVNVDADPDVRADIYSDAVDFVRRYGAEADELYMGHFIEHMMPGTARSLLRLIVERLPPGASVSAVCPDIRAIFQAYEKGEISSWELNELYIYSYVQPSHHRWCYDAESLADLFEEAGFEDVKPIDPLTWPPVYWKEGPDSRWQCGIRAAVPARAGQPQPGDDEAATQAPTATHPPAGETARPLPITTGERMLNDTHHFARALERERNARVRVEADLESERTARARATIERDQLDQQLRELDRTPTVAVARRLQGLARRLMPAGTRRRTLAKASKGTFYEVVALRNRLRAHRAAVGAPNRDYAEWCSFHDAGPAQITAQAAQAREVRYPLGFLCVVRAGSDEQMAVTLKSLMSQSWPYWQATVLVNREGMAAEEGSDRRIRYLSSDSQPEGVNFHVSCADPSVFVIFLEGGDVLAPDCLFETAMASGRDPLIDLLYWDDDLVEPDGRRHSPRFRPEWSPEMLLSGNYLHRSFATRQRRFMAGGGLRIALGDGAFWELLLRCDLQGDRVGRLPRVLSHVSGRRDQADESVLPQIEETLRSAGYAARLEVVGGAVKLEWEGIELPHVTVVIPTRHNRPLLERSLGSLSRTQYPSFDVVVVDNGARSPENEEWYEASFPELDLRVEWWDQPFNYSAVNNAAARLAKGEVLVFLNDDTEVVDPSWMRELVGWARRPEIGVVGPILVGRGGEVQHAGAVVGLNGFADHLFQGMRPDDDSLLGPVGRYRNCLAVTGACLAIRRQLFEDLGGFDERFQLCGSDVALGLDAHVMGLRNLCSPFARLRHLESATRGTHVPPEDFFTSYWRYQTWIFGGDPYFSPNLSLSSRKPALRFPDQRTPAALLAPALGRELQVFRQTSDAGEAFALADLCRADRNDARAVQALHAEHREPFEPRSVNWFIPEFDNPFYGGINTIFRIADHLARFHGVENRFVIWGRGPEDFIRSGIGAAFPTLAGCGVELYDGSASGLLALPPADVSVATLWATAYFVARFPHTRRKFYLVQDFEPVFYPAGTLYALAEESYRLGLYGLCNTETLKTIYERDYGGRAGAFTPAVDPTVFHSRGRKHLSPEGPVSIVVYARPGHWRNCWELASLALRELKERLGGRVRIVTAGSWAVPDDLVERSAIKHLGLLDYRATGQLYRECDIGVALTVSKHPSYLPLEFMACGLPVVAFDNPAGHWILRHEENSLLVPRTVDGLVDALERLVLDADLRARLAERGLADIANSHSDWDAALSGVYAFLADPEGA